MLGRAVQFIDRYIVFGILCGFLITLVFDPASWVFPHHSVPPAMEFWGCDCTEYSAVPPVIDSKTTPDVYDTAPPAPSPEEVVFADDGNGTIILIPAPIVTP